jgi:hypothetical protein
MLGAIFRHAETLLGTCEHRVGNLRINCARAWSKLSNPWLHLLFPQLRAEIHATLVEESSSGASVREHFHQSTALITTTSFISVFFFDSF